MLYLLTMTIKTTATAGSTVDIRPSSARKRCGTVSLHLQNNINRSKHVVLGAFCSSWACDRCRPVLEDKWITHVKQLFSVLDAIYVASVPVSRWYAVSTRIHRDSGDFITVEHLEGFYLVFTNSHKVDGDLVDYDHAVKLFIDAITGTKVSKPVSPSRKWSHKSASPPKKSEWSRVEGYAASVEEVDAVVKKAGYRTRWFWSGESYGFMFESEAGNPDVLLGDLLGELDSMDRRRGSNVGRHGGLRTDGGWKK